MDEKITEEVQTVEISNSIEIPNKIKPSFISVGRRLSSFKIEDFKIKELHQSSTHLLNGEGKLIRSALLLSSATAMELEPEKFVDLAVAIEMLHNASLIHDDIIDKDETRRGVSTVHMKYGVENAILAGNASITKAIKYASRYGARVVESASEAALDMCAGEVLDFKQQKTRTIPTLDEYLTIIGLKTASLMGTAAKVPAIYIGDESAEKALHEIGYNMGLSFQIRDDILENQGLKSRPVHENESKNAKFRPNIVSVLEKHGKEKPLKTAIKLNNFYVGKAMEQLDQLSNSDLFNGYLSFLEIK
ncbi:MAG: polyprenyl synthetase family protein [Candidatus Micrarchaeales archaeon]